MTSPTSDRRQGLIGNTPFKAPAALATTGPITLSGEQVIDGTMTLGSRVLVKDQANQVDNGLYDSSTGPWTRCLDADGTYDIAQGTLILVNGGSANLKTIFNVTSLAPSPGLTSIVWAALNSILNFASGIGATLIGNLRSFTGAAAATVHNEIEGLPINVKRSIIAGVFDPSVDGNYALTTAAINTALAAGRTAYLEAGTWVVENIALVSGAKIIGDGRGVTILKQRANATTNNYVVAANYTAATDTGVSTNLTGITISDLTFLGRIASEGFSQFVHLLFLNGTTDTVVERCEFLGFKGDGLYLAGGTVAGNERHNLRVIVRDCLFDGVTNTNRNAISVIDGDCVTIENNRFYRCTNGSTMPGAIDIEPDNTFNVIRDIRIVENHFRDCSGTNGNISLSLADLVYTTQPSGILIEGNDIDGGSSYLSHGLFLRHVNAAALARNHSIRVVGNRITRVQRPFWIDGVRMVDITDNDVTDTQVGATIGVDYPNMSMLFKNNLLQQISNSNAGNGVAIAWGGATWLDIIGNTFADVGKANGTSGIAMDFNNGTSSYVSVLNNRIQNGAALTTVFIQKEGPHTFTPATNRWDGNTSGGLGNSFQAGFGSASYNPPSLADGVGTTTTVTALGAVMGNPTTASFSLDLQGITVTSWVSAADTISVRFQNESGGTLDLANGTLFARDFKQS